MGISNQTATKLLPLLHRNDLLENFMRTIKRDDLPGYLQHMPSGTEIDLVPKHFTKDWLENRISDEAYRIIMEGSETVMVE